VVPLRLSGSIWVPSLRLLFVLPAMHFYLRFYARFCAPKVPLGLLSGHCVRASQPDSAVGEVAGDGEVGAGAGSPSAAVPPGFRSSGPRRSPTWFRVSKWFPHSGSMSISFLALGRGAPGELRMQPPFRLRAVDIGSGLAPGPNVKMSACSTGYWNKYCVLTFGPDFVLDQDAGGRTARSYLLRSDSVNRYVLGFRL